MAGSGSISANLGKYRFSTDARDREADHRREGGGEPTRFPEAYGPEEEDIRFYEAHAEDDEDDRFFEACAEETRGEETGCLAASEEGRHEGDPPDRAAASKRTDVLLPGPHEEVSSDSSDTDTLNPALVTGADPPVGDASQAPRAETSRSGPAASANSAITPPPKRSPSPDPSLRVDYEESESDMDREAGEVEGSGSSPPLTDEQRVLHLGSPMAPKTVAAIARARVLEEALSHRDDPPPATPES
ncbi:unnamed protein product [Phytophthora fragariaefolia]|uniref:Unnamed protein product n=1 Tax=Phytophthora fragariaefolia TaxID=1490495 RepID=A0A9W6Y074_9STRA|nr:unnamed protein product [Phytophthora fragariaefolia]